ncbi:MAG TPA: hypothetical protein VHG51_16590 [Longimicrobiaceae bacterium]|nr:hypothetical protein [Longimicrobiaceae bacterium]
MHRRAILQAAAVGLLALAPSGRAAHAQTLERDGQRVEVQVSSHPGTSTAVCLESAPGVRGRKRLTVSYGAGSAKLSVGGSDRGPHCAFFEPEGPRFGVRLEYSHLLLLTAILADRDFGREEFRGKTLTFRWVSE